MEKLIILEEKLAASIQKRKNLDLEIQQLEDKIGRIRNHNQKVTEVTQRKELDPDYKSKSQKKREKQLERLRKEAAQQPAQENE